MYKLVNKILKNNHFMGSMIGSNGEEVESYRGPGLVALNLCHP
jgi:hypothetical protein